MPIYGGYQMFLVKSSVYIQTPKKDQSLKTPINTVFITKPHKRNIALACYPLATPSLHFI